ncbi:MAG: hypothetical protein EXS50_00910 [Candidatus Taylorbacteria bacterium]|nr:hypothetical protein [Candidatus Taylorbacteria bacterium]
MSFDDIIISSPIWITAFFAVIITGIYFDPNLVYLFANTLSYAVLKLLVDTSPYWLPVFMGVVFWKAWMNYVRADYISKCTSVLLEIKLPQEIAKSPLAMETVLMSLYQTGMETTFIDRNWKGQVRAVFSLEIVSIEGQVKFYIHTLKKFKTLIETNLHSHYQGIEVHEATDYSKSVYFDPKKIVVYTINYKKGMIDAYPIKTYTDYGIDKEQVDEENKIDPLNHVLEFFAAVPHGHQAWLQIVIRAHKGEQRKHGTWFEKTDRWKDEGKAEVEKIRAEAIPKDQIEEGVTKFPNPTKGQQERIAAIERCISKFAFDTGIRSIYFGPVKTFDGSNISSMRAILRSFSDPHLNNIKPVGGMDRFDYPWEDFRDIRKNIIRRNAFDAYKRRSFFFPPHIGESHVFNVEELATMFHLPGKVATTQNLNRIPSKKSDAPSNLPI